MEPRHQSWRYAWGLGIICLSWWVGLAGCQPRADSSQLLVEPTDGLAYLPTTFRALPTGSWQPVTADNAPTPRHENGYVQVGDAFYLLGGRGERAVETYDPAANHWQKKATPPFELHHFQAVVYNDLIYVVGAYTGNFPYETAVDHIWIYNPAHNSWSEGPAIPRPRGSAGAALYNNRIYLVGGVVGGHGEHATTVTWVDEFDPATGGWRELPPIPHARDHFQVAVVEHRLYAAGGRLTGEANFADQTVPQVDILDFASETWTTLPSPAGDIPTMRAGSMTAVLGREVIVVGGEGFGLAWPTAEALNVDSLHWRTLAPLLQARHGSQIIACGGSLYVAAGSGAQGGAPELATQEVFALENHQPCLP